MSFDSLIILLLFATLRGQSQCFHFAQLRVEMAWEGHRPTFQLRLLEHRMDPRYCWQLQFVRNQTNPSNNLKQPIELWEKVSNFSSALLRFACKAEVQLDKVPYVKCLISSPCNSYSGAWESTIALFFLVRHLQLQRLLILLDEVKLAPKMVYHTQLQRG